MSFFFFKRLMPAALGLSAGALVLGGLAPALGIFAGCLLSLYRLWANERGLTRLLLGRQVGAGIALQLGSLILLFGFLLTAVLVDIHFFLGGVAGVVLLPLFICLNALTERFGITHNAWGAASGAAKER